MEAVNNSGRPTLYKPEYNELAYNYCLLGATDEDLALFFDVSEATVNNWKINKEGFLDSLKRGREEADANVANRLYSRAMGYEHTEDVIMQYQGVPVVVPTVKHYPPDTTAAIFWLKNRKPQLWRDQTNLNISGSISMQLPSPDQVDALFLDAMERRQKRLADVPCEVIEAKSEPIPEPIPD